MVILKSVLRASNHPLSRMLYDFLPESSRLKINDFLEITGKGIQATIEGVPVKVGSADFVGKTDDNSIQQTSVHIKIDGVYCGKYIFNNQYREGLAELFNTIRLVQKNLNPKLQIEGALLTMFDARLTLSKQVMDEVKNCFSEKIFKTLIPRNVKLAEAPSHGKPVIMYDIQSLGSKSYMSLAEELLSNLAEAKNG